jgi:hypothetical protein
LRSVFDLGEHLFDGVHIGAQGAEIVFGAGGADGLQDAGDLVRVEIVQDDEVSRPPPGPDGQS